MNVARLGACLIALVFLACGVSLTPADQAEINGNAATIAKCQAEGRACKADGGRDCYGVYESCMADAGMK